MLNWKDKVKPLAHGHGLYFSALQNSQKNFRNKNLHRLRNTAKNFTLEWAELPSYPQGFSTRSCPHPSARRHSEREEYFISIALLWADFCLAKVGSTTLNSCAISLKGLWHEIFENFLFHVSNPPRPQVGLEIISVLLRYLGNMLLRAVSVSSQF